jgi:hypothetical protein
MSMVTSTTSTRTWSPEVLAHAAEVGVAEYLQPVLEMTLRIFPNALRVAVSVENDPEIAGVRFLVIAVDVSGLSADQAAAAQQRWTRELFRCCPSTHVNAFCLGLNLVCE